MKLIIIYGPSASGKYTVGRKLADLTGYKLFHNHLTVDVVRPIFGEHEVDNEDPRRIKLLNALRIMCIETAARYDINMIFTVAYIPEVHPEFIPSVIEAVTKHGGTVHFVQLTPPDATMLERIGNESRRRLNKPTDPEHIPRRAAAYNTRAKIDYPSSISLDTSELTPLQSAESIIKHFGL